MVLFGKRAGGGVRWEVWETGRGFLSMGVCVGVCGDGKGLSAGVWREAF